MEKTCTGCKKLLPNTEFHKHKEGRYGTASRCKACYKERDYKPENHKRWREKHREEGSLVYWNVRAGKMNANVRKRYGEVIPVTGLELKDLFEKFKSCLYCGVPLTHLECHIDHKCPSKQGGVHEISNLAISCKRCNITKNMRDDQQFFDYIQKVYFHLLSQQERRQSAAKLVKGIK